MTEKFEPYQAPGFELPDSKGQKVNLKDFRGKWVVLYFYPKDETPGCTIEACSLRDARDTLTDMGAVVIGISRDDAESHEDFISKNKLNFVLLTDENHEVMEKYGAWGKKMYGREGILRKTFIINPDGMVVKVYGKVTPIGHGEKVIADIYSLIN